MLSDDEMVKEMLEMNSVRRGNVSVAVVTAISFLLTGLFVTHWGVAATIVGAISLLVFVFVVAELVTRRRKAGSTPRR